MPGDQTGPARDGFKTSAVIILRNDNAEQLQRDLDFIRDRAVVRVAS